MTDFHTTVWRLDEKTGLYLPVSEETVTVADDELITVDAEKM